MATSSEDIFLQVSHVNFKKSDGVLYVMGERIAWMMHNKSTFSVSHRYCDIKTQKISQDGKAKIQLQIILHDSGASTFHFTNPMGQTEQVNDRNQVKELLMQLLPRFKRKTDKELEEKNRLLMENPSLLQMYKNLVIPQVITSEEFWAQHATGYVKAKRQGMDQEIGVSPSFLSNIKPQTDGCNGITYNINAEVMESIFRTYPIVRVKHRDNVPHKISEKEFWTRFFQSHYFHRDRLSAGANKDIFAECAKHDEKELRKALDVGVNDTMVDLNRFVDNSLDDGYGGGMEMNKIVTNNHVHQNIIRRFNQHSIMVLKASEKQVTTDQSPSNSNTTERNQSSNKTTDNNGQSTIIQQAGVKRVNDQLTNGDSAGPALEKKRRIMEKIHYEDLNPRPSKEVPPLKINNMKQYLHAPTLPSTSQTSIISNVTAASSSSLFRECARWGVNRTHLVRSDKALTAVGELSSGGSLMRQQRNAHGQILEPDLESEISGLYISLGELLRHFWGCFPPTTTALKDKAENMKEALVRFQIKQIKPFEDKCLEQRVPLADISHLNQLVTAAFRKYNMWQQIQQRKPLR